MEVLTTSLLEFLEKEGVNFEDGRGWSYNNASNVSGHYTEMKARLKCKNPAAVFIHCAAHSLNCVLHNLLPLAVLKLLVILASYKSHTFFLHQLTGRKI